MFSHAFLYEVDSSCALRSCRGEYNNNKVLIRDEVFKHQLNINLNFKKVFKKSKTIDKIV